MGRFHALLILLTFHLLSTSAFAETKKASSSAVDPSFRVEVVFKRDDVIWGFDFLPDQRVIFTERSKGISIFNPSVKESDRRIVRVKNLPEFVAKGQGGFLDVRVHPEFAKNQLIFFTYTKKVNGLITTVLARARLEKDEFKDRRDIFVAKAGSSSGAHFGSRIEFDSLGHIFIQIGDRMEREQVQDLNFHTGKTIRIKEDGTVPESNPFFARKSAQPEIWSYGHRSPQGLVRHPTTGELWSAEMGPRGGDEVNIIKPGLNYGWPLFTYGREYYGPRIGAAEPLAGMEPPVVYWVPSISPSGMTFYSADLFPEWKGNLFLANLSGRHIRRLVVEGNKVIRQEELLVKEGDRYRNVRQGPDGSLYFSTDDGKLGRLTKTN
jgi:aldose sugar dehydrogenase